MKYWETKTQNRVFCRNFNVLVTFKVMCTLVLKKTVKGKKNPNFSSTFVKKTFFLRCKALEKLNTHSSETKKMLLNLKDTKK